MEWQPQKDTEKLSPGWELNSSGDQTRRSWIQFTPWSEFFHVLIVGPISRANAHMVDMGRKLAHVTLIVKSVP